MNTEPSAASPWFRKPSLVIQVVSIAAALLAAGIGAWSRLKPALASPTPPVTPVGLPPAVDQRALVLEAIKAADFLANNITTHGRAYSLFLRLPAPELREWTRHEDPCFFVDATGTWDSIPSDTPLRNPIALRSGEKIERFGQLRDLRNEFVEIFNALDTVSIKWQTGVIDQDTFVDQMGPILTKDGFLERFRSTLDLNLNDGRSVGDYAPRAAEFADDVIQRTKKPK